nr:ribbon-helix-helix domain-containing protein [Formicincola oecophyllae]
MKQPPQLPPQWGEGLPATLALECRLIKKSFSLAGHRTSVALEGPFWQTLTCMAQAQGHSLPALVALVDNARAQQLVPGLGEATPTPPCGTGGLASALRLAALAWAWQHGGAPGGVDNQTTGPSGR